MLFKLINAPEVQVVEAMNFEFIRKRVVPLEVVRPNKLVPLGLRL
jgi:hypothetical protein